MGLFKALGTYLLLNVNDSITDKQTKQAFANAHSATKEIMKSRTGNRKSSYKATFNKQLSKEMSNVKRKAHNREKSIETLLK